MKSLILSLALAGFAAAQDKAEVLWFGNEKCPMSGQPVDKQVWLDHEGQKIWFCGKACKKKASEDAKAALAKAYPPDKVTDVKNDTCPCMGKPSKEDKTVVFQGHRVRVCCSKCVEGFMKEPNKHLAMAKDKGLKLLGNAKCPVMPKEGPVPDLYVKFKGQLIGLCCDDCPEEFVADPVKFMKVLEGLKAGNR